MMFWACVHAHHRHYAKIWVKFPDYTTSPTFPWPLQNSLTFPGFQKSDNPGSCMSVTYPGVRRLTEVSAVVSRLAVPSCCDLSSVPRDCGGLANINPKITFQSVINGVRSHQMRANRPLPASATAPGDTPELCNQTYHLFLLGMWRNSNSNSTTFELSNIFNKFEIHRMF